jgi:hypothetical protein
MRALTEVQTLPVNVLELVDGISRSNWFLTYCVYTTKQFGLQ